ncbi:hypothetical protein BSKO_11356 [Bryopsis sp. KO-2023]|nr:hypothetical protein BSKO_11356 [Bryopsis sp. KO-2023]
MWRRVIESTIRRSNHTKEGLESISKARLQSTLAFEEIKGIPKTPSKEDPCVGLIVHGLLGAGRNWRSVSTQLAKQAAVESGREWRLFLVDLRNHGQSAKLEGFRSPHSIQAAAGDLVHFVQKEIGASPKMVVGHSMGGKVVLEYTRILGQPGESVSMPKQVWVLDSQPGKVPAEFTATSDVDKVLDAVKGIPEPVDSRDWLYKHMQGQGFSLGLAQWLGSNLHGKADHPLRWMFNVAGASDMYESYKMTDCYSILKAPPPGTTINVVRAGKSDRWDDAMIQELEQIAKQTQALPGSTRSLVLENAGHWLHVDNPRGLIEMMLPSML